MEDRGGEHGARVAVADALDQVRRACRRRPRRSPGRVTASATARVRAMSKPCLVPSRSMEVSRISPAPERHHLARIVDGVEPGRPAPAMGEDLPARRLAIRRTRGARRSRRRCTGRRIFPRARATKLRSATAAVLIDTLSAPARSRLRMSSTVRTPPPTVTGMKHCSAVRRTTSSSVPRSSWLAVMSRKQSSSAPAAS